MTGVSCSHGPAVHFYSSASVTIESFVDEMFVWHTQFKNPGIYDEVIIQVQGYLFNCLTLSLFLIPDLNKVLTLF